jgi:hypothetical protein
MPRDNTSLEAAAAEHLVIARLLMERIQAFRAQANQPGYDILAVSAASARSTKIQVKSRVATDSGPFRFKNLDFDFAVLVRLNLGSKLERKAGNKVSEIDPHFYVVPKKKLEVLTKARSGKVYFWEVEKYRDSWSLIQRKLGPQTNKPKG